MNNVKFVQNSPSAVAPLSNPSSTLTAPLSNDSEQTEKIETKIETQNSEESREQNSSGNSNHVTDNLSQSRDSIPELINNGTEIVKLEPEPEIQIENQPDIEMHITNQLQSAIQKYNLRNNYSL